MSEEETRVARQLREASERIIDGRTSRPPGVMFIGEDPLTWHPLEHAGEEVTYEPGDVIEVRVTQRKTMDRIYLTWDCLFRPVTPPAYAHRLEAVLNPKAPTDERLDTSWNPFFERGVSFLAYERMERRRAEPIFHVQPARSFVIDGIKEPEE